MEAKQQNEQQRQRRMNYAIKWKISEHRRDKRVGPVDPPQPRSRYVQMLFDEIEQFFRGGGDTDGNTPR
ncbi:hypothetical protein [Parageobacillus thermoglucosidasius]|uniref:hypothetical protein n=1 Tax=Parageobacillus thermoglucosidasius TaxID=1426 RepID=UPI002E1A38E8|nr:hypothetical protein [Parageobacillus thermoglucosidasius]MED4946480.1 hypothetical protein [Parageobacillus thermoglucosidasius]MED4984041.1 hypothetical protein [Parageobacillus thermoglucosidasius]